MTSLDKWSKKEAQYTSMNGWLPETTLLLVRQETASQKTDGLRGEQSLLPGFPQFLTYERMGGSSLPGF